MKLSNAQIKYIKSLHQSKFRQMYENFMAEGDKLVSQLIISGRFEIEMIVAKPSWNDSYSHFVKNFHSKLFEAEDHHLQQLTTLKTAPDVIAILKKSKSKVNVDLIKSGYSFYLDGVQDPGNVGTIIRNADWFGFKSVIRSEDSADFYNPKVVQATMGSIGNIELYTIKRNELIQNDFNIIATDMNGKSIQDFKSNGSGVIVLGSEGKGVSNDILSIKNLDTISISGHENTLAESLNVSVAAGIIAYEFSKKH